MEYKIIKSSRKTLSLEIKNGEIIVRAPRFLSQSRIEAFVNSKDRWISKTLKKQEEIREKSAKLPPLSQDDLNRLKKEALGDLTKRAEHFAALMGLKYGKITVRHQKTRWGSCSSKGNLNFNCLLMLCPDFVKDYIVVHELCHLKQMNHSPKFWAEVEKILPDYKLARKWLKEHEKIIVLR